MICEILLDRDLAPQITALNDCAHTVRHSANPERISGTISRRFGVNIFACACNAGHRCQSTVIDTDSTKPVSAGDTDTPAAAGCELFVTGKLLPTASEQQFACVGRTSASCTVA